MLQISKSRRPKQPSSARGVQNQARRDEPSYRRAFKKLVAILRAASTGVAVRAALRRGDPPGYVAELLVPAKRDLRSDDRWVGYARASAAAYSSSLETGGASGLREAGIAHKMRFSIAKAKPRIEAPPNPYSIKWIQDHGGERLTQMAKQQRELIRGVIEDGYAKGKRPEQIADAIKLAVGLTDVQQGAVEKRRDLMLENGADEETADAGAERYADQLVDQRADVIARTENKAAQEQGRVDAWSVAEDEGYMPEGARKKWVSMPESPRLSDICRELNDQVVDIRDPFISEELEGEAFMAPPAHPNCRSTTVLVFDDEAKTDEAKTDEETDAAMDDEGGA